MPSHRWIAAVAAVFVVVAAGLPANGSLSAPESHCIVYVVGQTASGELTTSPPDCYDTLARALSMGPGVEPPDLAPDEDHSINPVLSIPMASFTLGIHFDGLNGTGSSISVVGSSCTGGYWNTGAAWANRISSSWNGCYRLRHHDGPNKTGAYADTVGVGTHNVPSSMNNRTESVSYWAS